MASPLVKNALIFGISGAAGAASFSIWRVLTKSFSVSIRDKILSSYKDDFSKFLPAGDRYWGDIKKEYEKSDAVNRPIRNGKVIDKEDLPYWCAWAVDSPFREKDYSKLDSVLRWCYINTNSFRSQAAALKKELHGSTTGTDNDSSWKTAWESVKGHEGGVTDANALQKWCSEKSTITMFSNEAKSVFRKFEG
ncbi:hypothetical protein MHF_0694 [Mycoplasma haemofelis Ohio2]|uniref:Uncharacterized protein n=1 Tax=Mycoplasma haemofelis (strain Ohio2) TaxID=859194 RepID=F6FIB6_MYCHI|nr:hypothetical protein MHF_0694 [Mycoplasma haemofelis Ohio2]